MPMIYKSFSPLAHSACDKPAKIAAITFFRHVGIELMENPDQYGIDLLGVTDCTKKVECEHRQPFKEFFPYNTIHLLERKTKFCIDDTAALAVLNYDYTRIIICPHGAILRCVHTLKDNHGKTITPGEKVFDLPLSICRMFDVQTGKQLPIFCNWTFAIFAGMPIFSS